MHLTKDPCKFKEVLKFTLHRIAACIDRTTMPDLSCDKFIINQYYRLNAAGKVEIAYTKSNTQWRWTTSCSFKHLFSWPNISSEK